MWDNNDLQTYFFLSSRNLGQICNDEFSDDIRRFASNPNNRTFLEVGTWNGLGSTKAFFDGFNRRPYGPLGHQMDYVFYSLECNADKSANAKRLYANNPRMHILNEVLWNELPLDFYTTFPQCVTNQTFKHWNEVDIINMKKCPVFLNRPEIPSVFDVVLLDGGEFTTYYDFQLIKNRCKMLMLDDTNVDKCLKIVNEIKSDPTWRIIKQSNLRNGYIIAVKSSV